MCVEFFTSIGFIGGMRCFGGLTTFVSYKIIVHVTFSKLQASKPIKSMT